MYVLALTIITALLYLAAAGAIGNRIYFGEERGPARSTGLALAAAAVGVHAVLVAETTWAGVELNLSIFNALSLVTWISCAGVVAFSLRHRIEHLGLLLWPITSLAVLTTLFEDPGTSVTRDPFLTTHIVISMAAYAILLAAVIQAITVAILDNRLRTHRRAIGFVRRLPALRTMERQLLWLVAIGFSALTISLATGLGFFFDEVASGGMIHKTSLSIASWLAFGFLLFGHTLWGWRGQTAVRWTVLGFVALMLGYFGSKFVIELILNG
ncbi:CcsA-related protein [Halorhodospira halochloris]|uniref:CcsA-related protein n=1 Tax=Halorhodospira halochloris TaxID=1052 RepID=A0A0X8XB88_HALHR|nr:cytochrome c biogenesis protein CcsA [Halorhodospira halochloris]MBK1651863.1 hypothetical protein [Halorhodospira halochloris]MCG5548221.1 cytochrome c biogenesis protein CcsA [Halorhodospira halochloris]BAU58801.1 CcsA-related protein [Halorhodospira halochloris]